jgi:rod shape-determining protein MreD
LGAQIDVLPVLIVYCGLSTGFPTLLLTASLAGLCYDSLSTNPLGITVVPLLVVGLAIYRFRDLILREQPYARLLLGAGASAVVPLMTVVLLWMGGYKPLVGWGSLWQWFVLCFTGGILTPVCFWALDYLCHALEYSRPAEPTFRPDREIKRGRA